MTSYKGELKVLGLYYVGFNDDDDDDDDNDS